MSALTDEEERWIKALRRVTARCPATLGVWGGWGQTLAVIALTEDGAMLHGDDNDEQVVVVTTVPIVAGGGDPPNTSIEEIARPWVHPGETLASLSDEDDCGRGRPTRFSYTGSMTTLVGPMILQPIRGRLNGDGPTRPDQEMSEMTDRHVGDLVLNVLFYGTPEHPDGWTIAELLPRYGCDAATLQRGMDDLLGRVLDTYMSGEVVAVTQDEQTRYRLRPFSEAAVTKVARPSLLRRLAGVVGS